MPEQIYLKMGGAITSSLIDGILEGVWASDPTKWSGKFPYLPTIDPYLPPVDDWLVFLSSLGIWLAGSKYALKMKSVESFGEGMLYYSGPMIAKIISQRVVAKALAPT